MNRLSVEGILGDSSLESPVKNFINSKTQHIIELELFSGEQAISVHSSKKSGTFEKSSGILFFKSEKFSGSFSEL